MLSLKYVMAKSKELTSKLEISSVVNSVRGATTEPSNATTATSGSDAVVSKSTVNDDQSSSLIHTEGDAFLMAQNDDWDRILTNHRRLVQSGEALSEELASARKRLQDQVESEAYVTQHFHEIARVREQIGNIRGLIEKIAGDVQDVEQFLTQQTEEYMAAQNALFVRQQEQELERFEARILEEKEDRKKVILENRRRVLADAFQNDLKTYQSVVAYQGTALTKRAMESATEESLEAVDLVVTTDAAQLEAFYGTDDEDDPLRFEQSEEEKEEHDAMPTDESIANTADTPASHIPEAGGDQP